MSRYAKEIYNVGFNTTHTHLKKTYDRRRRETELKIVTPMRTDFAVDVRKNGIIGSSCLCGSRIE